MNLNYKLAEFQDVFESVFLKLKKKDNSFPQTEYKLASGHILILVHVFNKTTCTASDIASFLGITSGGVTGLTDTLLKNNLINRTRLESDRRVVQISLTNEGKEIVEQIAEEKAKMFTQLFQNMDEKEIEEIVRIFKKLNRILN